MAEHLNSLSDECSRNELLSSCSSCVLGPIIYLQKQWQTQGEWQYYRLVCLLRCTCCSILWRFLKHHACDQLLCGGHFYEAKQDRRRDEVGVFFSTQWCNATHKLSCFACGCLLHSRLLYVCIREYLYSACVQLYWFNLLWSAGPE